MSSIIEILKEYVTFDRVIMVATLIVAIGTLLYTRNKDKRQAKSLLNRKKAQLDAMESSMRNVFNVSEIGSLNANISALKAEIGELEEEM